MVTNFRGRKEYYIRAKFPFTSIGLSSSFRIGVSPIPTQKPQAQSTNTQIFGYFDHILVLYIGMDGYQ